MFRRPLVTYAFDADPDEGIALCRALSPDADTLRIVLRVPLVSTFALGEDLRQFEEDLELAERAIERLAASLGADGVEVAGEVVSGHFPDALSSAVADGAPDVIVFGRFGTIDLDVVAGWALDCTRTFALPCAVGKARRESVEHLVCPFDGRAASLAGVVPFLRDHCGAEQRVTLVAFGPREANLPSNMEAVEAITGVRAQIELVSISEALRAQAQGIATRIAAEAPDLIVVSTDVGRGIAPQMVRALLLRSLPSEARPVLFVPPRASAQVELPGELDAFDALSFGEARVRVERIPAIGSPLPLADQALDLVVGGKLVSSFTSRRGVVLVPDSYQGPVGLGRHVDARDPVHAIETAIEIVRFPLSRLGLFDARVAGVALERTRKALERDDRTLVAVRLIADESASSIRARLRQAGFERTLVVDVRDILDEGDASDVPAEVTGVRLSRAAARLRTRGAWVDSIVTAEPTRARGRGFAVVHSDALDDIETFDARARELFLEPTPKGTGTDLDSLTGSSEVPGNAVSILLENDAARRTLHELVDSARERFHAQWYIVEDDEVGKELEAALRRAAERGVSVKILVDSLYSLHDSFGAKNTLVERLSHVQGIEVRASHPIVGMPALEDLKRRDHRKLVIADGVRGVVSGRNLGATYFRAFSEVHLTASSDWREVPWLDASALLEGPVVADLDVAFREAWTEAGGGSFEILPCAPAGDARVRFVVHRGLADAYTLEAYLALIDGARERLVVVNSFPLQLEVQHAMLRAVTRGVKLSLLVGQVRPSHGADVAFAGGAYRAVANALVRARVTALLEAGADVREFVVAPRPDWDPALGVVRPYVHAKLLCADGRAIAVGSANLDVTAGYWESEALVIVDDEAIGRSLDTRLRDWLDSAVPIDPHDPSWREHAELRAWLGRVWPSVIG